MSAPDEKTEVQTASIFSHRTIPLFQREDKEIGLVEFLMRKEGVQTEPSKQGVNLGRKEHPFNMSAMTLFQTANPHHSTCIQTKAGATVGLGFRHPNEQPVGLPAGNPNTQPPATPQFPAMQDPVKAAIERLKPSKADKVLNPLCDHSFQDVLNDVAEDFWQVGNGYMEIVRKGEGDQITGLHHIPAQDVFIFMEDAAYNRHYEIVSREGASISQHFARWGDRERMITRGGSLSGMGAFDVASTNSRSISEVIHFRRSTSLSRWYGFPDWLAAVASIELVQCLTQFKFDFFLNRGVPEFMLFLIGQQLLPADWKKVEDALKANIGLGNSHKSLALNLANKEVEVILHKLAMDGKGDSGEFTDTKDNLALDIVTSHRVPPLLAGIQIPGKLGANNELPNALMAFQVLVIGPAQRLFQQTLTSTLGNPAQNGGIGLTEEDFLFRSITEEIDVGTLETTSRMRTTVREARAEGRDLSEGLKD